MELPRNSKKVRRAFSSKLKSPLKRVQAVPLPAGLGKGLLRASDELRRGDLADELAKVLRGGTGNLESRQLRYDFVMEQI